MTIGARIADPPSLQTGAHMTGQRSSLRIARSLAVLLWSNMARAHGAPTSVEGLVSTLADADTGARRKAAGELGAIGPWAAAAMPILLRRGLNRLLDREDLLFHCRNW
jgi:hypothetical protein